MGLEELLISIGDGNLAGHPNGKAIQAYVSASLGLSGKSAIKPTATGTSVLTKVYAVGDLTRKETILKKEFKSIRDSDRYKSTILTVAGLLALCGLSYTGVVISHEGPVPESTTNFFIQAFHGLIEVAKLLIELAKVVLAA